MHSPETRGPVSTVAFQQRGPDVYVCHDWPPVIEIARSFLNVTDPAYVVRDGFRVDFTVANGQATYQIVRDDAWLPVMQLQKCHSTYAPMPPAEGAC